MERPSVRRSQNGSARAPGAGSAVGTDTSPESVPVQPRPPSSVPVTNRIKVAVVDPHPLYRQGLVNAMAGSRLVVVAEGGAAEDAERVVQRSKPDVLLLDISVSGDGMGAAQEAMRARASLKVVVLT